MSNPRKKPSGRQSLRDGNAPGDDVAPVAYGEGFADEEQIRARAYELYLERGGGTSDEMEDWLRAEREYRDGAQGSQRAEGEATQHPPPA